jgi:RHS repeat-associated protein
MSMPLRKFLIYLVKDSSKQTFLKYLEVTYLEYKYKYKYNGKEWQDELGLNVYDMEARNYMPDIGRWGVIDELAEDFYEWSPYNFSFNNPINFSDPSGLSPEGTNYFASTVVNKKGEIIDYKPDGDNNIYLDKRGGKVVGKEREGVTYEVGKRISQDDLNKNYILGGEIIDISRYLKIEVEPIEMYFWPAEVLNGGVIKAGTWLNKLRLIKFGSRIKANNLKELKALINKLSKPNSPYLTQKELNKLNKLVEQFGGKVRRDLNPVKKANGRLDPHVQIEGFGTSIKSRHIFIKTGVK